MPGPKQIVVLQLPSGTINQTVTVQVHRLVSKKEKASNKGEYRDTIVAVIISETVKIRIPYGAYDVFVETVIGKYGLLGLNIDENRKIVKFGKEDLLMP